MVYHGAIAVGLEGKRFVAIERKFSLKDLAVYVMNIMNAFKRLSVFNLQH